MNHTAKNFNRLERIDDTSNEDYYYDYSLVKNIIEDGEKIYHIFANTFTVLFNTYPI